MNFPNLETLIALLILSALPALLLFAFGQWRKSQRRSTSYLIHSSSPFARLRDLVSDPWIAPALLFIFVGLILTMAARESLFPPAPEPSVAMEIRSLSAHVSALTERLDSHPPTRRNVDRSQLDRIQAELRQMATRMAAVEARPDRRDSRGSSFDWGTPIGMLVGAVCVTAALILAKRPGAAALTFSAAMGAIALVQLETESLFSYHAGSVAAPYLPPMVVVDASGQRVSDTRAYVVPFDNNSRTVSPEGRLILDAMADGLRPCRSRAHPPLTLVVRGFASSAPFANQARQVSNDSNLSLANNRTGPVVRALSEKLCDARPCTADSGVSITAAGPWLTYNRMMGAQAFGDASTPNDVRRATEFFTRAVLVTVEHPGRCAIR